jgi:glycosyltransferase involved in cell wall biosynthesis
MVGEGQPPEGLFIERSKFATSSPLRRIIWEQAIQPFVLNRIQPDIYHALAFVSPLIQQYPTVITVHDLSFMRFPDALSTARRTYLRTFTRLSCQRASKIIAVSESTRRDLIHLLDVPPDKIAVVTSGVSEAFKPLDAEAFRREKKLPEKFFLFLGTLEPRKNLAMLVRAYEALPDTLKQEVHLVLAGGKGWDYDDIFAAVRSDTVHFPGYISQDELPLWYNAATALVYPSIFEGWGLPVVEAMACGCPTLVSNVSSLPEAAGDTGMLLPPDDEASWTTAMRRAIEDDEWRQQSAVAGIERAAKFTWQATASATVDVYREVMRSL